MRETRDNSDPALANQSSRVNCVVDLSGGSDLTILARSERDPASDSAWLGGTIEEIPETYRDASPLAWADAETVPFLVIHSGNDELVPVEHARRLVAALQEAQVDVAYVEFARGGHLQPLPWLISGP